MNKMMPGLGAAALAIAVATSAPAGAQSFSSGPFDHPPAAPSLGEPVRMSVVIGDQRSANDRRRRGRGLDGLLLYDRDYQGDTAWRSDSFNDWWHDQPHRSFPRWVQENARTCDRMWYSGNVLRC